MKPSRFNRGFIVVHIFLLLIVLTSCTQLGLRQHDIEILSENSFIDSMGNEFETDKPYERVITLYSAHTENAFTIGAGHQIIGVNQSSIYPPEAASLPMYDYKFDPEPLIASNPDLVIIRPFINRNYNEFISAIEKAGIPVVSLFPEDESSFKDYVTALGIIFGKQKETTTQLKLLESRIKQVSDITSQIPNNKKVTAFFESTKSGYKTVTIDSNPAKAIEYAGGINIANDVKPIETGSTIAEYGIEKLMMNADEIDVYISQRGAMNSGGSVISIPQREGFGAIKAVNEERILEINEKIISSPTFRYYKGVLELARMFYPELMDNYDLYRTDDLMTRSDYALLLVKFTHTPIFVPSSSHYYEKKHLVHTYGHFTDVNWQDEEFDYIETAATNSYIKGYKNNDGTEYFKRDDYVTRADVAYTLYIMYEIKTADNHVTINDLDKCEDNIIIQKIVDNGFMQVDGNGDFNPDKKMSGNDITKVLERGYR